MPFKVLYMHEELVIDFTNIVIVLQLISVLTLWVWLYAIVQLLSHYSGPLYFD